jgi:hypothetical protein
MNDTDFGFNFNTKNKIDNRVAGKADAKFDGQADAYTKGYVDAQNSDYFFPTEQSAMLKEQSL